MSFNPVAERSPFLTGFWPHSTLQVLALVWLAIPILHLLPATAASAPMELKVMSFNLRYASTNRPNAWPDRRPVMKVCIESRNPDVLGTQEGLYPQLQDMSADLPGYAWIGTGRDGGSRGEFMAVFYKKNRLEPLEYDHFWLSDTPNVIGSAHWGNTNRRMVTWVRFRDRQTSRQFYVMNTHLDHAIQAAREKGAKLILERAAILGASLPLVLIGDFNAEPGKEPTHDLLTQGGFFRDAWQETTVRKNEGFSTFHDFGGRVPGSFRIDWVMLHGPWKCREAETVIFSRKGQFPSDHHPVLTYLHLD